MKIFLDPGHGPGDGAVGRVPGRVTVIVEESKNWQIVQKVEAILEQAGHDVMVSRRENEDPSLKERASRAAKWKADIAFSIHHNVGEAQYAKTEVYVVKSGEPFTSANHKCDLSTVFGDAYAFYLEPRNEAGFWKDRARNVVYPYTPMGIPCALIECGYLNVPSHQNLMVQPIYISAMANSIGRYVLSCVARLNKEDTNIVSETPANA
jgi:N-acetylmuramoyl-L-alanine amidase